MPTIAELQVKADSSQVEKLTKALNDMAASAEKAAKARKALNDANNGGGSGGGGGGGSGDGDRETKKTKDLSEAIDAQIKKLARLAEQRKALNESSIRTEDPEKYKRLNAEIDARTELVRRQGNSLDRLAGQAERERKATEAAAEANKRKDEQAARALAAREASEARFAAAQQRQLDATLAGLSQQIKVQQQYNKEMETLNLQRFQGGLSAAQFDTYTRLAAAKRDDALATADNSREVERNQRQLDSVTATLGRAERAEFLYSRAVKILNESLALGSITQEQYNNQLAAHTVRRDNVIAAVNNNTAAEARFSAQLKSVLAAYDPLIRANDQYAASQAILRQGLANGEITIRQYVKALREQKEALDVVKGAQSGTDQFKSKQYQDLVDKLVPYNVQLRNLAEQEKILTDRKAAGKVVTEQQIKDYERATKAIAAERVEIERRNQEERRGNSAKQDAAALRGLPAQFTDVVVSLQGGQAPLTVLLQQGGQVKDMFGGIGNAAKAVGGALLAMINPLTIAGTILGVFAFSAWSSAQEVNALRLALQTTGVAAGLTVSSATDMARSLDDVSSSTGNALQVISKLAATGKVTGENFEALTRTILLMNRTTGASVDDLVADFSKIGKDPVAAVNNLIEKYGILDSSFVLRATTLTAYGEKRQAIDEIEKEAARVAQEQTSKIAENLTSLQKFARDTKDVFGQLGDAISKAFRSSGNAAIENREALIGRLQDAVTQAKESGNAGMLKLAEQTLKAEESKLRIIKAQANAVAERKAEERVANESAAAAQQRIISRHDANVSGIKRAENELKKNAKDWELVEIAAKKAGRAITQQEIDYNATTTKGLEKRLKDARESAARSVKGPGSPVDNTEVVVAKVGLEAIRKEYESHYKKVTALGAAHLVSEEATTASQKAILGKESAAIASAYDKQIDEIKKLQGNKKNNAAQNINLNNQLVKAEADKTKALEDLSTKQEVLETKARGLIDARAESVRAYKEVLAQQFDNVVVSGERAVSGVGKGDRQNALDTQLDDNDRQFNKDRKSLEKEFSKSKDTEEYLQKLKELEEAHSKMTKQIISNDENIRNAEGDWYNGLTKAVQNYADAGSNFADIMNNVVSGAFDSMGDALGNFVTTGQISFKSLAASIISDMAKIAAKAATNSALSSLFQIGISAYSAYSGGGGNGLAAGSAGATSSNLGASQAGYSSQYFQEKGGAWSGGTQFFANGGAFTNSIVSSPTEFGMKGGRGVMGEAGPEAIIPLARTQDGALGVRMVGGGQQQSSGVNVYVSIQNDGSVETSSNDPGYAGFGKELGVFVESQYNRLIARDLKPGGALKTAMTG